MAEGPLGPLRLELEEGRALLVISCASEAKRIRVACRILQDGWILDEPDVVVDMNGDAELSVDLGPRRPIRSDHRAGCPMMSEFTRFEPPIEARVRLSIRAPSDDPGQSGE